MATQRRQRPKTVSPTSRELTGVCPACPMAGQLQSTTTVGTVARRLAVWLAPSCTAALLDRQFEDAGLHIQHMGGSESYQGVDFAMV